MPNSYWYSCINCDREKWLPTTEVAAYLEAHECVCSIGSLAYAGMYDEQLQGIWYWFANEQAHYFLSTDGKYYYLNGETWVERGANTAEQQALPDVSQVIADAAEVAQTYPTNPSVQNCMAAWREVGIRGATQRHQAMRILQSEAYLDNATALRMLQNWNSEYPDAKISAEEANVDPTAQTVVETASDTEEQPTRDPDHVVISREGTQYHLTILSDAGSYHRVFTFDATAPPFPGVTGNEGALVRIPRANSEAPMPHTGYRRGLAWQRRGFPMPTIYNASTLERDGYYVVERIAQQFDRNNNRHLDQVQRCFTDMATSDSMPDFRPDNVRFRQDGTLVLIDFSEDPDTFESQNDLAATLQNFAAQFAGGDLETLDRICSGISEQLRNIMRNALQPWQQ